MTRSVMNFVKAGAVIALGLAIAAMGFYVAEADDAPGAGGIGLVLMLAAVVLGVKIARNRLPVWAGRITLVVAVVMAALAVSLTQAVAGAVPLFVQPPDVPSISAPAPSPQWTAAVDRARPIVRAAIVDQNLPGLSIAVGMGADIVWAEGFGWRDAGTETPVTPDTRFNIGTAASVVTAASVASLGLTNTGTDSPTEWSPEAVGEPGEDFPPLAVIRHLILQPLGLAPAEYPLPGDRATFYVPKFDDTPRRGRRLMYMRDLACCADGMAFYSTPSDLVRFALATKADSVNGTLAGGSVMTLLTRRDNGLVVAVTSNVAHAKTAELALKVADAFAEGNMVR
jgi:hypothetical protein